MFVCVWQTEMKIILQSCGLHAIFCHCKIFHFFLSRAKENKKFQSTENWNSQKCLCRVKSTREKKTQSLFTNFLLFHATSIKKITQKINRQNSMGNRTKKPARNHIIHCRNGRHHYIYFCGRILNISFQCAVALLLTSYVGEYTMHTRSKIK